jgi:ubiquinone/menaquinone biosynthesis C-methylase UbiE
MGSYFTRTVLSIALGSACFLSWCCSVGCRRPEPARNASISAGADPKVNAEYRNADVATWVARFESSDREVFRYRHELVDAAGIRIGQHVADIGAGTGVFTFLLADKVGPFGHVYAVDVVPEFLAHIDALARERKAQGIRTVLATSISAKLPPDSIDVAFVCDTYHHLESPRNMLASVFRALRDGGVLIIVDFERIPGVSRPWILDHVRCGREDVIREVTAAGFEQDTGATTASFLNENYFLKFRKPG